MLTPADIDRERQREARALARIRHRLLALEMGLGGALLLPLLLSGMAERLRDWVIGVAAQPVLVVGIYFVVVWAAYGLIMLPMGYYGGFRLPHRYGLSTQTLRGWVVDEVKSALLGLGLGLLVVEVIYYLLRVTPELWWLIAGGFMVVLTVVLANLAPILLVPLFYKLEPVADEGLVRQLEQLAARARTSVRGVYTIDLSSKTKAANAMIMGLGNTRRIVLGDTLCADYEPDEIETILAHELAHQVGHDMWWGVLLQSGLTLMGFYVVHLALHWGMAAWGLQGLDDVAGLPLVGLVMGLFFAVTTPLGNGFSRWRERLADDYALRMTGKPEAFISAMVRLANQNLADVDPERWVELLLHSHPAVGRRISRGESFLRVGGNGPTLEADPGAGGAGRQEEDLRAL
jgi:STE24 endopeptidase